MAVSTRLTAFTAVAAATATLAAGVFLATAAPGPAGLLAETDAAYTDSATAVTAAIPAFVPASATPVRQANVLDTNAAIVDGRLYLWGFFGSGANPGGGTLGAGTGTDRPPSVFAPLTDIVDVSGNAYGFKALDLFGNLWSWGTDGYGENGGGTGVVDGSWAPRDTGVTAIASSEYANAWLTEDGTVKTTGTRFFGQRGTGFNLACAPVNPRVAAGACAAYYDNPAGGRNRPAAPAIPVQLKATPVTFPASAGTIVTVAGAYEGFYAVDDSGRVFYWGRSYRGGAGLPASRLITDDRTYTGSFEAGNESLVDFYFSAPVEVPALTALVQAEGLAQIGGGYAWGGLLTQAGKVYTWGTSENNASGHAAGADVYGPRLLLDGVTSASFSFASGRVLMDDGTVQAWGARLWGGAFRLPGGAINTTHRLALVYDGSRGPAVAVGGTKDTGSYSLADGTLWTWGENGAGAACGGKTYARCSQSVTDLGGAGGLYVWPAIQTTVVPS